MIKVGTLVRLLPGAIAGTGADPHALVEGHCYFVEETRLDGRAVRLNGPGTWVTHRGVGSPRWVRYRFTTDAEDYRPIAFPPPGPWWCSGFGDQHATLIAYLPDTEPLTDWWPEAQNVDTESPVALKFTDRFPKPSWWIA